MNQGFILLHRKFMSWEWYQDKNTKILFIHCLLKANFETKEWQGIEIKRGQFFTSVNHLSIDLKMSIKEIRTGLKKLQNTNEIVQKGASKGTMITVCKYDSYQSEIKPKGKRRANEGQARGKRGATTNNDKQLNNDNNENNKENIYVFNFKKELLNLGIENQIVEDWLRVRKTKRATNSEIALNAIKKQITLSGKTANECIQIAVENSWSGFKAEWVEDKSNGKFKKPDFDKISEHLRKIEGR